MATTSSRWTRIVCVTSTALAVYALANCAFTQILPPVDQGVLIYDGTAPINVSSYSAPTVCDWNKDGKRDLVVGQRPGAMIRLYINKGTDIQPSFSGFTYLKSHGADIVLPGG